MGVCRDPGAAASAGVPDAPGSGQGGDGEAEPARRGAQGRPGAGAVPRAQGPAAPAGTGPRGAPVSRRARPEPREGGVVMKNFIGWLLKAYAVVAAYALALAALVALVLIWNGALTGDRVRAAFETLRGRPSSAPVEPPAPAARPTEAVAEREQILEKRTQELQVLEERIATRLALIRAEQETLERKRQEAAAAAAEAKKAQ